MKIEPDGSLSLHEVDLAMSGQRLVGTPEFSIYAFKPEARIAHHYARLSGHKTYFRAPGTLIELT